MIELLLNGLRGIGIEFGPLRVLEFLSVRILMAALTALVLALAFGHHVIVALYRRRMRDTGGDYASINTSSKRGTPTAGGLMILLCTGIAWILWGRISDPYLLAAGSAFFYYGLLGLADDWLKMRFKSSLFGLGEAAKLLFQVAFAVPFAIWFVSSWSPLPAELKTTIVVPFIKNPLWDVGPWVFCAFLVIAFLAVVNAVNLTDGLDGLVTVPAMMSFGLYGIFGYILGNAVWTQYLIYPLFPGIGELSVFTAALVGGLAGFLWYNAYPAEVFMGDTGSMAIGGSLAAVAFLTRQELLLPLTGGIFVASAFSSFVQSKLGDRVLKRRIFLRAPVHHSQTEKGIAEPKVVVRYWIISLILTLLAALSIKVR